MLGQDDQIKLFKQGSFEVVVTWYTLLLRPDGMFTPQLEKKIPRYGTSVYCTATVVRNGPIAVCLCIAGG